MSYIERKQFLKKCADTFGKAGVTIKAIEGIVDKCTTADVVEVRHGYWRYNRHQAYNEKSYFCSLCAEGESDFGTDKYCNACGAKMDGERRENETG